jgi:hypothetical protein
MRDKDPHALSALAQLESLTLGCSVVSLFRASDSSCHPPTHPASGRASHLPPARSRRLSDKRYSSISIPAATATELLFGNITPWAS